MAAAVEANGGVVLERIGDSVLAVFRNAGAAARAAVAAREAVNDIAWPPECDVSVTIVLHSGRWSGDPRRPDAGTALMRLARIATVAERGQVLVSQATASLIEGDRDAPTLRSVGNGRLPTSTSRYVSTR
ncbi:MAG: hypothetical protein ACXVZ3_07635 [Gaiellaceae bacterium]